MTNDYPTTSDINWNGLRVVYEIDRDQYGDLEILHFEIEGVEEPDLWADYLRDHGRGGQELEDAIQGKLTDSARRWIQKSKWNPILAECESHFNDRYPPINRGDYP